MFSHVHSWRPLRFPIKSVALRLRSVSAAMISADEDPTANSDPADASLSNPTDPVRQILTCFTRKNRSSSHCFRTLVLKLNQLQVDKIIDNLGVENPESAIEFFYLMRNEYGCRHSIASQFVIAHIFAGKRRFKELRSFLQEILQEEGLWRVGVTEEGFCSAPSSIFKPDSNSQPLYWKVTNPTLSPSHLQDLPGFTRSVYRSDHALITPESHVFIPLPDWTNTLGAYLISPAGGAHFVMYLAKMQENSSSGIPPHGVERFVFVVQGTVTLTNVSGGSHKLIVDSYAYLPPNLEHSVTCDASATLVVFERRYAFVENHVTEQIVSSTNKQPVLQTPGEVFELRKLLPASMPYDFNIHIMDFQPGEFLNVKEVHYNQHGLLLLEGQGIYRLGDSWYPVQAGDAIWMAPFVPQWYAAVGKTRTRYLLYKDVNRNPL